MQSEPLVQIPDGTIRGRALANGGFCITKQGWKSSFNTSLACSITSSTHAISAGEVLSLYIDACQSRWRILATMRSLKVTSCVWRAAALASNSTGNG
jgi:hypothetical protein